MVARKGAAALFALVDSREGVGGGGGGVAGRGAVVLRCGSRGRDRGETDAHASGGLGHGHGEKVGCRSEEGGEWRRAIWEVTAVLDLQSRCSETSKD